MLNEHVKELYELSHKTENNLVVPLMLEYLTYERWGAQPNKIMEHMRKKYNPQEVYTK